MKKIILTAVFGSLLASCISDDAPKEIPFITPAKYKVEVVHEGKTNDFNEIITVSAHLFNGTITDLKGVKWDSDPTQPTTNLLQFYKTGGNPQNITIETSEAVEGISLSYMLTTTTNEELTTKVKYYKNDKFIKETIHKTNKNTFTLHSSSLD